MIHWIKESRFKKFFGVGKTGKNLPEKIKKALMSGTAFRLRKINLYTFKMRRPNLAADTRRKKNNNKKTFNVRVTKTHREANRVTNYRESQCLLVRNGLQIMENERFILL